MEGDLYRFNLTHLISLDRVETIVEKGGKKLIVASLGDLKVVMKETSGISSEPENLKDEISKFFFVADEGIATCLGYAYLNNKHYLVFEYSMFTVKDWLTLLNQNFYERKLGQTDSSKNKWNNKVLSVFSKILKILYDLFLRGFGFVELSLYDFFIDNESLDVQIFNLEEMIQGDDLENRLIKLATSIRDLLYLEENVDVSSLASIQEIIKHQSKI